MELKFLNTGFNSAAYNFAVDEAILNWVSENKIPVLRFYGFSPTACTIGYFQGMDLEIDMDLAKKKNVEVVRRPTGGGAVMHDQNQFTYTLVIPESMVPKNILESYEYICKPLILALNSLGLNPTFAPLNDIILNGQKISGNAQTRKKGCVLQHGTLLMDVDVDLMFSLLKVPDEKMRDKLIKSVKKRVTSVNDQLEKSLTFEDISKYILESFCSHLKVSKKNMFDIDQLDSEIRMIQNSKYESDDWNFKY